MIIEVQEELAPYIASSVTDYIVEYVFDTTDTTTYSRIEVI